MRDARPKRMSPTGVSGDIGRSGSPADDLEYVLDTRDRARPMAPRSDLNLSSSYAVCANCHLGLAREHRCAECPVTMREDGRIPADARLVRYV